MSGSTWEAGLGAVALAAAPIPGVDIVVDALAAVAIVGMVAMSGDTVRDADDKAKAQTSSKATTTPCSDCEPPDCKELQKKINNTRNELKKRYLKMREDDHDLYTRYKTLEEAHSIYGSWDGHILQFKQKQKSLRSKLSKAKEIGCPVSGDSWKWATIDPPIKPAPP